MSEDLETETCGSCRQPSIHKCAECDIKYCSSCEDQDHWSKCKSYEVCYSGKSGVYLKAVRDLFAGEIIFCELPLVYGPKLPTQDGDVPCVGCCRIISAEKMLQCPECLWPACSSNCEGLKNDLKHGLECKILRLQKPAVSEISAKYFRFEILLPLRILLLQVTNKSEWENLSKQDFEKVDFDVNDLPIKYKFTNDTLKFLEENYLIPLKKTEEESGIIILEQKSLEILNKIVTHLKTTKFKSVQDVFLEIFYPIYGHIEHSCTPNSFHIIETTSNQYKITIRANSVITKNTHITSSSTDLLRGTYERLADLKTLNIACSCSRCKDATELGTFFSALKCLGTRKESCGGTQLPIEPTNSATLWICDKCKIELPNDQVVKFVKHLENQVGKALAKKVSIDQLEELLAKLLMFLHPNHFLVCDVKHALIKLYDEDSVLTKIDICKSLVEILRKFYPNGGRPLAELLLELIQAKFSDLEKNCDNENKSSYSADIEELEEFHNEIKKSVHMLFDLELRKILAEEEAKLDAWLHHISIT